MCNGLQNGEKYNCESLNLSNSMGSLELPWNKRLIRPSEPPTFSSKLPSWMIFCWNCWILWCRLMYPGTRKVQQHLTYLLAHAHRLPSELTSSWRGRTLRNQDHHMSCVWRSHPWEWRWVKFSCRSLLKKGEYHCNRVTD